MTQVRDFIKGTLLNLPVQVNDPHNSTSKCYSSGVQAVLTYGQRYVKDSKVTPTRVIITLN